MKRITPTIALLALLTAPISSQAGERGPASFGQAVAASKCLWCHGASGQGFAMAPRLAGQRRWYLENQLRSFRAHKRDNPFSRQYMWRASITVNRSALRDLAVYFSRLPAKPANDGNRRAAARGRVIYSGGLPAANIPACVACHGPNAQGIRQIPRLGGQSYHYLKRRLTQWGQGYDARARRPMPQVAGTLSASNIEALASYLSFVK